jgi:lipopolysaccharide transport system permease protein
MFDSIVRLFNAKQLLWAWTGRNIRARYQQSALGWLWALIQPAAQAVIFTVIFTLFVPVKTDKTPYILFSYVALAPWTFFAISLTDMAGSLVGNMVLVTKIYFPREALPMAGMLARLMDFGIAALLLIAMMLYFKTPVSLIAWLCVPAILATQILLMTGLGLAAAAASVFYRDIQSLLTLVLQLWFYACPIVYPASVIPARLRGAYYLNPMAGILEAYRDVLLNGQIPGSHLLIAVAISLCVFLAGYWFFQRVEFRFADVV